MCVSNSLRTPLIVFAAMNCFTFLVVPLRSTSRVVFLLVLLAGGAARSQSWVGGVSADWSNPNNWSPAGVPSGVTATVNASSGNLATVLSPVTQQPSYLSVGTGAAGTMNMQSGGSLFVNGEMDVGNGNSGTGIFNMSGGTLTVNGWLEAGRLGGTTANGTYNLTGGIINQSAAGNFDIGEGVGMVNVSNMTVNVGGQLWVGQIGNGTLTLTNGGVINASNWVVVARGAGTGVFNMSAGTFTLTYVGANANHFVIGNGVGTVNQSGGSLIMTNGADLRITETGTGLYNQSGGTASLQTILVGSQASGSAELRLTSGAAMTATSIVMGNAGSMTSVVNLNGGILQANAITIGSSSGTKTFNFNGGTLKAGAASSAFMSGLTVANVRNGGAVIDDGGFAINMAQALVHSTIGGDNATDGGLTKQGGGTLELNSASSYTGPTIVKAGTLKLDVNGNSHGLVYLTNGVTLNLNYSGTNIISGLYTDGVALFGVYNSSSLPGFIAGGGSVQVSGVGTGLWTGDGANYNWSTAGNWNQSAVPIFPIGLTFAGSTRLVNSNDLSGITADSITFVSAAGPFVLGGNGIQLGGNIGFNGNPATPVNQTVNLNMALTTDETIDTPTNGNLTLGGAITSGDNLFKLDAGTLTLGGTNAVESMDIDGGTNIITGNTTINGNGVGYDRLYVGDGDAIAGCFGTVVIQPGAVLDVIGNFNDTFVIGRDSAGGGRIIQNGGTFIFNPSNNHNMVLGATSNPILRSEYDMNGGLLDMSGGQLSVGWAPQTGSIGFVNQIGGVITNVNEICIPFINSGNGLGVYTLSGGSVYLLGGGIVNDGPNYAINLGGGTIGAEAGWSSSLNLTLTGSNGPVTFDTAANTITLWGALSGNGGLTKIGSGTLDLSGVNSYTGATTVNTGILRLDVPGMVSTSALSIANGAVLNLNSSGTYTVVACYTNNVALGNGVYNAGNLPGFITGAGLLVVGSVSNSVSYSYLDLIGRLTNLDLLAQLPVAGETSSEWSSRDRSSVYDSATGQYLNWGANNDGGGFISTQPDGGIVMAEMTGPGCIWRIWAGQAGAGHVEIFLDGSNTPAVDLPFANFFNGTQSPFIYPSLSYPVCEGLDSYVPIPYNASCKVVAYGSWGNGYFHFNYSTFPPGVTVPTFTTNLTAIEQGALSNVDNYFTTNLGTDPAGVRGGETTTTNSYAIAPGQSVTPLNLSGQGAVTGFKVRVNGMTGTSDQWRALRALTVSMSWDGETNASVWAPLGDFFGTACGYIPYTALPLGMQTNGWMYCYWYMPFASQAQIVIGNDDSVTRNVDVVITYAPLTKPIGSLARFHAKWNRGVYVTNNGRSPDYRFLTTSGQGRLIGLAMHVYQTVDVTPGPWWGEGDEKFFVDGEKMPSWFGTGSEDYFGFSWGTPGYFSKPYHTQALAPPGTLYAPGHRALNRFQITDNVPFQASFEGCIEKWCYTNDTVTTYGTMPYWYLASGGCDAYKALVLSSRTNYYVPPH